MMSLSSPTNLPSSGHIGQFTEWDRESFLETTHPGVIRFYGMSQLKQVFTKEFQTRHSRYLGHGFLLFTKLQKS